MLALSFLGVIGALFLIAERFGLHVPKGYVYFAMACSVGVEMLNLRMRQKMSPKPVKLHPPREAVLTREDETERATAADKRPGKPPPQNYIK